MIEQHFRIIELPEYQVLLTKDFDTDENGEWEEDEDDSKPLLIITVFFDGIKADVTMGFSKESSRDEAFLSLSDAKVQSLIESITV